VRVLFDPESLPSRCWFFEAVGEIDGHEPPTDKSPRLLTCMPNGYVEQRFENCVYGRKYGIQWTWEVPTTRISF